MDAHPPWVTPMPAAEVDYVVEKFREACMRGKAKFDRGQIKPIAIKELYPDVRYFYSIAHQQTYQLTLSRPAYLVTFTQKPGRGYYPKGCAIIARDLPFVETWEKVLKTKFTPEQGRRLVETDTHVGLVEYPLPEEKMKLSIQRLAGPYVALQVSQMGEQETRDWKTSRPFLHKAKKEAQ
jgi:hypothetical protein